MIRRLLVYTSLVLLLASCVTPAATGPQIHVENAWARPAELSMTGTTATPDMQSMPGMTMTETPGSMQSMSGMADNGPSSAAYFVIVNDGNQADTLTGVMSDAASQVSMHETTFQGDVAQMAPVSNLNIPAHGKVEFKPGGYHVMLEGLTQSLPEGSTLKITLQFKNSGNITLDVPIKQGN